MLFSSLSFLFAFLPLTFLAYYLLPSRKLKNMVLLLASLFFYAWGEPKYILLMLVMIIINYLFGLWIAYSKTPKLALGLSVAFDLLVLGYYKYAVFFLQLFNYQGEMPNITLPIGISFYTFQIISYLIDVKRKDVEVQKNIFLFACYVSLFPQLIAGPIVRYKDVAYDLINRKENLNDLSYGLRRFCFGLAKKILLANNLAIVAEEVFAGNYGGNIVILGIIAYALQIYFDFSGYSDMAIGLGKMFGFAFLENFDLPYIASSITDFWRRWHISLSSWFRDYVYIPLGGSRKGLLRQLFNLLIVWSLTGLWHGAALNFVYWGLWYFFWLVLEKLFLLKILKRLAILNWLYSLIVVCGGWLIFNASVSKAIEMAKSVLVYLYAYKFIILVALILLTIFSLVLSNLLKDNIDKFQHIFIVAFVLVLIIYFALNKQSWLVITLKEIDEIALLPYFLIAFFLSVFSLPENDNPFYLLFLDILAIIALLFCVLMLVNNTYNPFIYFRF